MIVVAAAAAALAIAAVFQGIRNTRTSTHSLKGSVSRRIALFSTLAGVTNSKCSTRPERRIEMTTPKEEYGKGMRHALNPNPPLVY